MVTLSSTKLYSMSVASPPPHSENISLEINNSVTLENENMIKNHTVTSNCNQCQVCLPAIMLSNFIHALNDKKKIHIFRTSKPGKMWFIDCPNRHKPALVHGIH